jgi:hypothetical protein
MNALSPVVVSFENHSITKKYSHNFIDTAAGPMQLLNLYSNLHQITSIPDQD